MSRSSPGGNNPTNMCLISYVPHLTVTRFQPQEAAFMIRFVCDSCERTKGARDPWLLGLAAEAVGLTTSRREMTILPAWDSDRAVHPLAVHFCSDRCKDRYLARLFDEDVAKGERSLRRRKKPAARRASSRRKKSNRTKRRMAA